MKFMVGIFMVEFKAACRILLPAAAAVGLCLAVPDDEDAKALPDGAGKAEVVKFCTECHGPGNFRKTRHDKDEWTDSVADMVERGAKGTPAELAVAPTALPANDGNGFLGQAGPRPLEAERVARAERRRALLAAELL